MAAGVTIRALQGESLDALVWRATGATSGIEQVLDANPGIAGQAEALPQGFPVVCPVTATASAEAPLIQLWD